MDLRRASLKTLHSNSEVRLSPRERRVLIRSPDSPLQKIHFRTASPVIQLPNRAIHVLELPFERSGVTRLEILLAINQRQKRIKQAPLRLASRLQKLVPHRQRLREVRAPLLGRIPVVVI